MRGFQKKCQNGVRRVIRAMFFCLGIHSVDVKGKLVCIHTCLSMLRTAACNDEIWFAASETMLILLCHCKFTENFGVFQCST